MMKPASNLQSKGIEIRLNSSVAILEEGKKGVVLQIRQQTSDGEQAESVSSPETFDELILCCPADEAKEDARPKCHLA